jgi:hypothetical protein
MQPVVTFLTLVKLFGKLVTVVFVVAKLVFGTVVVFVVVTLAVYTTKLKYASKRNLIFILL